MHAFGALVNTWLSKKTVTKRKSAFIPGKWWIQQSFESHEGMSSVVLGQALLTNSGLQANTLLGSVQHSCHSES